MVKDFVHRKDAAEVCEPHCYQVATQLGRMELREDLPGLPYPQLVKSWGFLPYAWPRAFDPAPMRDIADWVQDSGERLLFLYGENDPWAAAPFEQSAAARARDNHWFVVPEGNHQSSFMDLPQAEHAMVLKKLCQWAGIPSPYEN